MKITGVVSRAAAKASGVTGIVCFEEDLKKTQKQFHADKFTAKKGEAFLIPSDADSSVLLLGLGKKEKFTLENVRKASARTLCQAKTLRASTARLPLDGFGDKFSAEDLVSAAVEGARLSDYRFGKYKSKPSPIRQVSVFEIVASSGNSTRIKNAVTGSEKVCEGVVFTRDLANEPANVMTPAVLAQAAKKMATAHGLKCRVLGKAQMQRLGMGGILGVAQGSVNPPQFVILEHRLTGSSKPIVLVGKGVTFDTGGISIKPSNDMDKMKFDMCGAAGVLGTLKAVAEMRLPIDVIGIIPATENMPSGGATRPGDIVTSLSGQTVEILNTDAEGRLILCDALTYAERFEPQAVVDIATLTGACVIALGHVVSGLFANDEALAKELLLAGETAYDRAWHLPLYDDYQEQLKSNFADFANIGGRPAGAVTAACFLARFTKKFKWAHLDIAGTAWKSGKEKGATGRPVPLLTQFLIGRATKS